MTALTTADAYALSRALSGLDMSDLTVSPAVSLLLGTFDPKKPEGFTALREGLRNAGLLEQVFAVDPKQPLPTTSTQDDQAFIPDLPKGARLSKQAIAKSEKVAPWLSEFMKWSSVRSPMTPLPFLEAGGIWAIGLAIARRVHIKVHATIYPHLYILWIAPTSIFKKSTGLDCINDLVIAAMPHMLLPEESSPEALISMLSGKKPANYDTLPAWERSLDDQGRKYCAQRGILIDEASTIIGASGKKYMEGFGEMVLRLYDAPRRYMRNVRSEGKIIVRNASLSILGATTPTGIGRNATIESWETGEFARYALLFPDHQMPYDTGTLYPDEFKPPEKLVAQLKALHEKLPKPPDVDSFVGDQPPDPEEISAMIDKDAFDAYSAYARAVSYDLLCGKECPDARLQPNYARLHIQALKIAISLAAIDWADSKEAAPRITIGHWAKAQSISEEWRRCAHRLIDTVDQGEDLLGEMKIYAHLLRYPDGETLSDLVHRTHLSRKLIQDCLGSLMESGKVAPEERKGSRGPAARVYKGV